MKLVHVIVGLEIGGAETMLKRLVTSHLTSTYFTHSVVSLTDIGPIGRQLQKLGIEVHSLGMRSAFDTPFVLWKLTQLIRRLQADIVQTWMYHADFLGGIAARLAGKCGVIWGIRTSDLSERGSRQTALVKRACAYLSHFVPDVIVCAGDASRQTHIAAGYDASRMVTVPNGFDVGKLSLFISQRDAFRQQYYFSKDSLVIGFLGRFHPDKDPQNFVRAAGIVAQEYPNARFLMVGRGLDANNGQLARWIELTGVAEHFVLIGERSDAPVCLAAMDVFCLSSRIEGFPNAVGEAMAVGLPCVTTDVGDAAVLVGNCGVVLPKEDSVALANGLKTILAMPPNLRVHLGQRAKERILAEYSIDRTRERFEVVYLRVARGDRV